MPESFNVLVKEIRPRLDAISIEDKEVLREVGANAIAPDESDF